MSEIIKISDSFYLNLDHVLYVYIEKRTEALETGESELFSIKIDLTPIVINKENGESSQRSILLRSFPTQKEAETFLNSLAEKCAFLALADT